ncbi:MAG: 1-hydroxycarotenoid 3,4-desaturase CrtD [Pseudomonadota bacterium]
MPRTKIAVIGSGVGGLAAACDLARQDLDVVVLERASAPGGKIRQVTVDNVGIDAGPTVFTMRWIFESLFEDCGATLSDRLGLNRADILARHAWLQGGTLDLFADIERSADAIGVFAGPAEAKGFREFCARSADIFATLKDTFIAAPRPSPVQLVRRVGFSNLGAMWRTAPFQTMWSALGQHFRDPRLRQLFGRYSTYCGASPLAAPATLMLIAYVEQEGVWLVDGGINAVAKALQSLAEDQGASFRFDAEVEEIMVENGGVAGVRLADGERISADAVIFNGDVAALGGGMLGRSVARAARATPAEKRSLSAITWCRHAHTRGFNLHHHNVFFAEDYPREFRTIFDTHDITEAPTVYVCAQDRGSGDRDFSNVSERLLLLVNAPANGDERHYDEIAVANLWDRVSSLLKDCGLEIEDSSPGIVTTPTDFNHLFPATGGALYGRANHGSMASFDRQGASTRIDGLYLAGGSVHPGPGIPMAAMSGRLAAAQLISDQQSR